MIEVLGTIGLDLLEVIECGDPVLASPLQGPPRTSVLKEEVLEGDLHEGPESSPAGIDCFQNILLEKHEEVVLGQIPGLLGIGLPLVAQGPVDRRPVEVGQFLDGLQAPFGLLGPRSSDDAPGGGLEGSGSLGRSRSDGHEHSV